MATTEDTTEARDALDRVARTNASIIAICSSAIENSNMMTDARALFRTIMREAERIDQDLDVCEERAEKAPGTGSGDAAATAEPDTCRMRDIVDNLENRLRWVNGAIGSVLRDPAIEEEPTDALAGAQRFIEEAHELAEQAMHVYLRDRQSAGGEE